MVFIARYQVNSANNRRQRVIPSQQLKQSSSSRDSSQQLKQSSSSRVSKSGAQTIVIAGFTVRSANNRSHCGLESQQRTQS
ncbi:hypothetical protein DPMN_182129 [Dreissena polymorpha]|uniref:Uncharacterized protein n=1 Tax=Dreissena polymorpha TaxID=45954 RepID=A0A9D4I4B3_DREPO|nr:hypothetical protein DPMN_182129 [Dreissena polymorpha]